MLLIHSEKIVGVFLLLVEFFLRKQIKIFLVLKGSWKQNVLSILNIIQIWKYIDTLRLKYFFLLTLITPKGVFGARFFLDRWGIEPKTCNSQGKNLHRLFFPQFFNPRKIHSLYILMLIDFFVYPHISIFWLSHFVHLVMFICSG